MKPVFLRVSHAASHVGKRVAKFRFDITVETVTNLPANAKVVTVMWQRGAKSGQTQAKSVQKGEAVFKEQLQLVATLYQDVGKSSPSAFESKDYKLSVFESVKGKKVGKTHIDLAQFAGPQVRQEVVLTLQSNLSSPPKLKIIVECRYISDVEHAPSVAFSDLSFATSGAQSMMTDGNSNDSNGNDLLEDSTTTNKNDDNNNYSQEHDIANLADLDNIPDSPMNNGRGGSFGGKNEDSGNPFGDDDENPQLTQSVVVQKNQSEQSRTVISTSVEKSLLKSNPPPQKNPFGDDDEDDDDFENNQKKIAVENRKNSGGGKVGYSGFGDNGEPDVVVSVPAVPKKAQQSRSLVETAPLPASPKQVSVELQNQTLKHQVTQLQRGKEASDLQNLALMEKVQKLTNENKNLVSDLQKLMEERNNALSQLQSLQGTKTAQTKSQQPQFSQQPQLTLLQQVEKEYPELKNALENPTATAILDVIAMQSVIKQLLGREIRELETQVQQLLRYKASSIRAAGGETAQNPNPSPSSSATTTTAGNSLNNHSSLPTLLAHIESLQSQLAQSKADNTELFGTISEISLQFNKFVVETRRGSGANRGDEFQQQQRQLEALSETVRMLGDHLGNVLQEKAEISRRVEEEREALAAEKDREMSADTSYMANRVRRLELELAAEKQQRLALREKMQGLEEQNAKFKKTITALGQQVVQLEVSQTVGTGRR